MWRDHPFRQRNKAPTSALGLEVGGKEGGWTKFENRGGRQYRGKGGGCLHKIEAVRDSLPTMRIKEHSYLKIEKKYEHSIVKEISLFL